MTTLAHADAVTDWNETAIRAAASIGISTGWQSRIVAITHAAMFDAVNSIERKYTQYAVEVSPPAGASAEAAAITAAHAVLTHLVPDQKKMLDAALTTTLAKVADGAAKDAGTAVGREVAAKLLELRSTRRHRRQGRLHAGHRARRLAADAAGLRRRPC